MHHRGTEVTEGERDPLTQEIIGGAIEVHRSLGPGLLESAYEECLAREMTLRSLRFERQKPIPIHYKGAQLDCGYRLDFVVEKGVVLELKSVDRLMPIHEAQVLTYLKQSGFLLLMNFNVAVFGAGSAGSSCEATSVSSVPLW